MDSNNSADVSAVILAGGKGTRIASNSSSDIPKQYLEIGGKPVLSYSVDTFSSLPFISEIIVVASREWLNYCNTHVVEPNAGREVNIKLVEGGIDRQESSLNGVKAASAPYVMVHDGARPFVSPDDIRLLYARLLSAGAAILAIPIINTIKEVAETLEGTKIVRTVPRDTLLGAVTPQAFQRDLLIEAHRLAQESNFSGTDDASLLEHMGSDVEVVTGSPANIKITTNEDLVYADFLVRMFNQ